MNWLDISLERDTDSVPRDGRYHVVHKSAIVYSSANLALAEAHYEVLADELRAANPARARARSQQAAKGGKGGRSGV